VPHHHVAHGGATLIVSKKKKGAIKPPFLSSNYVGGCSCQECRFDPINLVLYNLLTHHDGAKVSVIAPNAVIT